MTSNQRYEPEAYELLDQRDEEQILAEIKGNIITEMFYSFPLDGKTVTGVSWVGTKEIARRYGYINIDFVRVDETNDAYIAIVKATDTRTDTSLLGTAMQSKLMKTRQGEKPDRFAYTKAVSKAQRNAIRAIIPERFLIEMYEQFKKGQKNPTKTEKPPRKKVKSESKVIKQPIDENNENVELVFTTLEANGLHIEGLRVFQYGNAVWIQVLTEMSDETWDKYNTTLHRIKAEWNADQNRWEIPL